MNDLAFLFGLRARIGQEEALAANDRSFENDQAAVFGGVNGIDLLVKRLLVDAGAVDEHGNDVRMAQTRAKIFVARVVRRSGVLARPFLLRQF